MVELSEITPDWVRERMRVKGLRQADVAAEIGIEQHKLSKSLLGHRKFKLPELEALGRYLCDPPPQEQAPDPETAELMTRVAALPPVHRQIVRALVASLEQSALDASETPEQSDDPAR
jgi:hypothetical protein